MTPRQKQAQAVIDAMLIAERQLQRMKDAFVAGGGGCCVWCAFPEASDIAEAQERRIAALEVQCKRDALPEHVRILRLAREGNLDLEVRT